MQLCADFAAGLADGGVRVVFVSPGSRNTPLTLAIAREPRLRDVNIRDERSAGFMALGYGKATRQPAAVLCTSGSAATHYFPAVVEADQDGAPLIVMTADRPAALRNTYAPQTLNQVDLYGSHVKRFFDVDDPTARGRVLGVQAVHEALLPTPGAVHFNFPFEEPLVPASLPPTREPEAAVPSTPPYVGPTDALAQLSGRRVVFVASGHQPEGFAEELDRTARALGAPIIADPRTPVHGPNVIHHADLMLGGSAGEPLMARLMPDMVVRLGPLPTSKPWWQWLEESGVDQILVHDGRLEDPLGSATVTVDQDPTAFLRNNLTRQPSPTAYVEQWSFLDAVAGAAAALALEGLPFPNEPEIARSVMAMAPSGSIIYVASSRPIRDVDAFAITRPDVSVLANRGVNGIDGTVSSAIGASLSGSPVTLLIGDIAALHDVGALAEAATLGVPLRIIVVNNDGGGIFSFLPQASSGAIDPDVFEQHWGTPHGLAIRNIATAMGLPARLVSARDALHTSIEASIDGPELLEITTDREANTSHHRAIRDAVADALRGSGEIEERA
jgi:2-succinyl-5-enolpyruvyl-6-hydroxy-3-cyclohexene-1-carboxylate synthase